MKEYLKKLCTKTKAGVLALLTICALTLVIMLFNYLMLNLADREYAFTLDTFWGAFIASGCGVGIVAVYKDMLEYIGKD